METTKNLEKYSQDKLGSVNATGRDDNMNSLIMEFACEGVAEKLTSLQCELEGVEEFIEDEEGASYTEEAQDIFNEHYDDAMEMLYKFVNRVLKIDVE